MNNKSSKEISKERTRNWGFIMYPESVPKNYIEILNNTNIKYAISPLHNQDINEETKDLKKPHWHCVLVFDSVKTFKQVKEITDLLNAPVPQKLNSIVGAVRYFTHKDNKDKYQYDEKKIITGNGFELTKIFAKTALEKKAIVKEITQYIIKEDIVEFIDLVEYAINYNDEWFEILQEEYIMYFTALIRSNRHSEQRQRTRIKTEMVFDKETGEIIK